ADGVTVGAVVAVLVAAWGLAGLAVLARRPREPLGLLVVAGAAAGAAAARWTPAAALLPALGVHLLVGLPDGRLRTGGRRAYVAAVVVAATGSIAVLVVEAAAAGMAGVVASNARYQRLTGFDRQRSQWFGLAVVVATELTVVVLALRLLVGWPRPLGAVVAVV